MQEPKSTLVRIGDYLFKYRNILFPIFLIALCSIHPPIDTIQGNKSFEHVKDVVAILVMLIGLGIRAAVIGYKYIKRGGLNKKVYADTLVTDGFFATCRNPLYVGNVVMYISIFLMHGDPVVFVLGMGLFLFIYTAIIAAEEYFLRSKFGEGFEAYCRDVPRWLPKLSRLREATEGMKFNWGRVIAKDYTTIINGLFCLMVIEFWEEAAANEPLILWPYLALLMAMVGSLYFIRKAKKRGSFGAI